MGSVRRQLAAQIRSMRVAVEAMQRHLAGSAGIVLRLTSEHGGAAPGEGAPPHEQQGS